MVVLVGNNPLCVQMEERIHVFSPRKKVLFAFQDSVGICRERNVKVLHMGKIGMTPGYVHQLPDDLDQSMLCAAFGGSAYKLSWGDDMQGYLYTHAAFAMPVVYLCYRIGCDLRKAHSSDIKCAVEDAREGFPLIEKAGMKIGRRKIRNMIMASRGRY